MNDTRPHRIGTTAEPNAHCTGHDSPVYDRLSRFCEYVWDHRPEIGGDAYTTDCRIRTADGETVA